ncbi:MAG: sulfide/dihydroorotate dehydrogenase-like FAD/NAD-binding protein [Chloroflexi bacterium]|nr:sulfide/dihydroorotate dehydrogenase-like FAD/NAD-binding protein [Chloroflexota bacterium]
MYKILHREDLTPQIHLFRIHAPAVAKKARAGQFVILMVDEKGERFPLTIGGWDRKEGSVTIVFMEVGTSTRKLAALKKGDSIYAFIGPLGIPTHTDNVGTVVCVAGGFATAIVVPVAQALKDAGNRVVSVMGFRNKELMFWEDKLKACSDELIICTDDGSYGRKALVTEPLKEVLEANKDVKMVVAIGPTIMMKFASATTKPFGVKTIVSLNPIMVDGTGMCGCCRVEVGGKTEFTCVNGPDFDGHKVDWDVLMARQKSYTDEEKRSLELWQNHCKSQMGGKA